MDMKALLMSNYGPLGIVVVAGVIILTLFIVLRFFRAIFSVSFVGFILSLVSYFVYEYYFMKIPLIAAVGFLASVSGFTKSGIIGKIFALIGTLLSGYIIIHSFGLI